MRPHPLIAVHDVEASSGWYQQLLGRQSAHSRSNYERLMADSVLMLQLHHFALEDHTGQSATPTIDPTATASSCGSRLMTRVIVERLKYRTNNSYGRHPDEVARVLDLLETVEPLLRRVATREIDTRACLDEVVTAVLRLLQ